MYGSNQDISAGHGGASLCVTTSRDIHDLDGANADADDVVYADL